MNHNHTELFVLPNAYQNPLGPAPPLWILQGHYGKNHTGAWWIPLGHLAVSENGAYPKNGNFDREHDDKRSNLGPIFRQFRKQNVKAVKNWKPFILETSKGLNQRGLLRLQSSPLLTSVQPEERYVAFL